MTNRDYYLDMVINDDEFHDFAFFKYGLIIDYDKDTDELLVNELEGVRSGKYDKEMLSFLKSSIDRFGSLEEFQKIYKEFKETHNANNTKDIQEINKEFRKEFGIPDRMAIPCNLDNLIDQ